MSICSTHRLSVSAVLFCALTLGLNAIGQGHWHVKRTIQVGGDGGMDYITVDPSTHRLFVPRGTHTMVINAVTGKTLGDIPGQKKAHGVALVPNRNRGFITDGGGNGTITVFDMTTYAVLGVLAAVPDADGIIYDSGTDTVLVSAGDSKSLLTFRPTIDPAADKIDPPIQLGGSPEFLAADGAGRVYVNLEDKDVVAAIDLKTRKVVARWPVAPGGAPVGLALDASNHMLFIGGRKPQKMIIMSTENGKVLSDLPIGAGVDAVISQGSEAFASCGDGTLTVVRRQDRSSFGIAETVKTARGAKTLAIDTSTNEIYLPTADFEDPAPGSSDRTMAKPGTFKILVVAP